MVFEEMIKEVGYEEAAFLFDEAMELVKSPIFKAVMVKAFKAAVILSAISIGKGVYTYLKNDGLKEIKSKVAKATLRNKA